jgi:hypothetical protein
VLRSGAERHRAHGRVEDAHAKRGDEQAGQHCRPRRIRRDVQPHEDADCHQSEAEQREERCADRERCHLRAAEVRPPEEAEREHRELHAPLDRDERGEQQSGGGEASLKLAEAEARG